MKFFSFFHNFDRKVFGYPPKRPLFQANILASYSTLVSKQTFRAPSDPLPPQLLLQQREGEAGNRHVFHRANAQSRHVRRFKSHSFPRQRLRRRLVTKPIPLLIFRFINDFPSVFAVLPKTTPEGYRVIYCKVLDSDPSRYIQTMALRIFDMVCELSLQKNGTEEGQIIIMDMDGILMGHVGRLSLMTTKIYLHYLQVTMS